MPFTTKTWVDAPDDETPIDSLALIDLEERLSDYTDDTVASAAVVAQASADTVKDEILDTYKSLYRVSGTTNASIAAGTFMYFVDSPSAAPLAPAATGIAGPHIGVWHFDPANYAVSGRTTKLRLRTWCTTIGVAPAANFTVQLYAVTSIAAGAVTLGAAQGSSAVHTAPAANSILTVTSADFDAPAVGPYAIVLVTSAITAASSGTCIHTEAQMRQV